MHSLLRNKLLVVTYLMTFLYALHYAIPVYATSSYLHTFFNSSIVSGTYVLGSILSLVASLRIARSIRKFHTYQFTFAVAAAEIVIVTWFGHSQNPYLLPPLFVVHFMLQTLLYICLNVFIESFSAHAKVGSIRGLFLAILNLGILISPLIGGYILKHTSFATLYTTASLVLIPYLFLLHKYLSHIKEPAYHEVSIIDAARRASKDKNLRAALMGEFLVQAFYAIMVIYSPLYLSALGVPLTSYLSIILPIALIPLIVLPYELGYLADKKYGEKEMLLSGLLILGFISFVCVTITSASVIIWALVFFISRIGASLVDTMSFSYYFKKVEKEDPSLTALFITMHPVSVLATGTVGVLLAPFLGDRPQLMFIVLGCAILLGISQVLPMKDTR